MKIKNLSEKIRHFCKEHHVRLNTDLGQHFLIDQHVLDKIVEVAQIHPKDHIVEIGPGIGILTKELLKHASKVTAIELDERMIPLLEEYVRTQLPATSSKLQTIHQNALHVPMPKGNYTIVANIPYHITSPLLRHVFLESETPPKRMTLLMQREVADRICDVKNTSMLTIIVGLFGAPKKVINVPSNAFLPPPKVDSAVIHINCFEKPLADAATLRQIMKLTKIAFSMKRKMLRNSFSTFRGGLELLSSAGIDEKRRPQTLSIAEWIAIANVAMQAEMPWR